MSQQMNMNSATAYQEATQRVNWGKFFTTFYTSSSSEDSLSEEESGSGANVPEYRHHLNWSYEEANNAHDISDCCQHMQSRQWLKDTPIEDFDIVQDKENLSTSESEAGKKVDGSNSDSEWSTDEEIWSEPESNIDERVSETTKFPESNSSDPTDSVASENESISLGEAWRYSWSDDQCDVSLTTFNPTHQGQTRRLRRRAKPRICLDLCSYDLLRTVAEGCGMRVVPYESEWDVLWSGPVINEDTHMQQKRYQRTNHFPCISELVRKDYLADNLNKMKREFPKEYNIFPRTHILPHDLAKVQRLLKTGRTMIMKPDNGSNGNGIYLVRHPRHLAAMMPHKQYICQEYIKNPLLIDGLKFDIRLYILITCCDPLRIYTHQSGLVRFATVKYKKPNSDNLDNSFMHLTNYSVNKNSTDFVNDGECGSKRKISAVNQWLRVNGYDVRKIWSSIDDVTVKTILCVHPTLKERYTALFSRHHHRTACFQLLGFDILLDNELNPYVLEVNNSPSFYTDTQIDLEIKTEILRDTFKICHLNHSIRKKVLRADHREGQIRLVQKNTRITLQEKRQTLKKQLTKKKVMSLRSQCKWESAHRGNYRLIYPCSDGDRYSKSNFDETEFGESHEIIK